MTHLCSILLCSSPPAPAHRRAGRRGHHRGSACLEPALTEQLPMTQHSVRGSAGRIRRRARRPLPGHPGYPAGPPPGAGLPFPRPRRSVHAGAVGPCLQARIATSSPTSPARIFAGHDPPYEVCLVAHRAGHDARRPGAEPPPRPASWPPAGKIRCIPALPLRLCRKTVCCGSLLANNAIQFTENIHLRVANRAAIGYNRHKSRSGAAAVQTRERGVPLCLNWILKC